MTPEAHRAAMHALCIATISSPAESRMRSRTAREQHAAAMEALHKKQDDQIPDDSEDDSSLRNNVLR
jgi:hypothetical protein